jgi:hypothetical protein
MHSRQPKQQPSSPPSTSDNMAIDPPLASSRPSASSHATPTDPPASTGLTKIQQKILDRKKLGPKVLGAKVLGAKVSSSESSVMVPQVTVSSSGLGFTESTVTVPQVTASSSALVAKVSSSESTVTPNVTSSSSAKMAPGIHPSSVEHTEAGSPSAAREFALATLDKANAYESRRTTKPSSSTERTKAIATEVDPFSPAGVERGAAAFDGDTVAAEAPATKKGKVIVPVDGPQTWAMGPWDIVGAQDLPPGVTFSSSDEAPGAGSIVVGHRSKSKGKSPTKKSSTTKKGLTRGLKSKQTQMIDKETQKLIDEGF